jgi:carbon monoxide dehydrogenase subunit G
MKIEGSLIMKAPIQEVWDFLLAPGTLASCVPGAEKIESADNKIYNCLIKQKVGPISVKLQFVVDLAEMTPPTYVKAIGRGEALGKLGTFSLELVVHLNEKSSEEVEVAYTMDVTMVGRIATFGERIMRAKVDKVGEEFTNNLKKKLQSMVGG